MLRKAWGKGCEQGGLLENLRQLEAASREGLEGGQLSATSANGRSVAFADTSPYVANPTEIARGWDELIRLYNKARRLLNYCFANGLDPVNVEAYGNFATPTPPQNPPAFTEADVYEWLMGSEEVGNFSRYWPGQLVEITECRGDYGSIRIAQGQQFT